MRTFCLRLSACLLLGCVPLDKDDGTGGDDGSASPVGGWHNDDLLYACFAANGDLGVGDQRLEAQRLDAGRWDSTGRLAVGNDSGTWSLDGDVLTLGLDCEALECGPFDYARDDTLDCGQ
jgi:hypothetical protein